MDGPIISDASIIALLLVQSKRLRKPHSISWNHLPKATINHITLRENAFLNFYRTGHSFYMLASR
jgi:hypothetical protein